MTIAHLSDTHLGFRAYARTTAAGFNQREADVMRTFCECLDAIAKRDPDLVVHAGDVFHVVRPSNATIVGAYRALSDFQRKRREKPLVIVGGNHDTPRTADSGNILQLFSSIPGIRLVPQNLETLDFPELDLEVMCVPSHSLSRDHRREYLPSVGRTHRVLSLHGMARQVFPDHADFDVDETRHEEWSYVALGDYHVYQPYGANICYAGSTDYASTNIWDELRKPKGWVWFDTSVGRLEFVTLSPRLVIDLPAIDASNLEPRDIEAQMEANAMWPESSDPIVRQKIVNVHSAVRGKLGQKSIRALNARCLNYQIQTVPAQMRDAHGTVTENFQASSLEQNWEDYTAFSSLPATVDRAALNALGLKLLQEVAEREIAPIEA